MLREQVTLGIRTVRSRPLLLQQKLAEIRRYVIASAFLLCDISASDVHGVNIDM